MNGTSQREFTNHLFQAAPEFGIFLQNSTKYVNELSELALTFNQSKLLMNRTVTSHDVSMSSARAQSLLNPDNVHEFYYQYSIGAYKTIKKRFKLSSDRQVDALMDYMTYQIEYFLNQGEHYDAVTYGQLL